MTEPSTTNPYSELSFWRFALLAAVVVAFLPWSLLVHGFLKGFADTKLLVTALVKDYVQTLIATFTFGLILIISIVVGIYQLWPTITELVTGIF